MNSFFRWKNNVNDVKEKFWNIKINLIILVVLQKIFLLKIFINLPKIYLNFLTNTSLNRDKFAMKKERGIVFIYKQVTDTVLTDSKEKFYLLALTIIKMLLIIVISLIL